MSLEEIHAIGRKGISVQTTLLILPVVMYRRVRQHECEQYWETFCGLPHCFRFFQFHASQVFLVLSCFLQPGLPCLVSLTLLGKLLTVHESSIVPMIPMTRKHVKWPLAPLAFICQDTLGDKDSYFEIGFRTSSYVRSPTLWYFSSKLVHGIRVGSSSLASSCVDARYRWA